MPLVHRHQHEMIADELKMCFALNDQTKNKVERSPQVQKRSGTVCRTIIL